MVEVSSDGSGGGRDSRCFHGDHFGNCGGISAVVLWISVDPLVITFLFRTRVVTLFNFFFHVSIEIFSPFFFYSIFYIVMSHGPLRLERKANRGDSFAANSSPTAGK